MNLFNTIKKRDPAKAILLKGVLIPKLPNNPLAFCSLVNFDFLLSHTAYFDKSVIFQVFFPCNFRTFTFRIFFYTLNAIMRLNCNYTVMRFLISSPILSYGFSIFIIETNSSWLITESIKTLEYKTSVLFNLDFANNTTLLEFLFYFIDFYLLIAVVIAQEFLIR